MSFPRTRAELQAAGYRFDTVGQCRGNRCHGELHWWWTPKGRRIPLDKDGKPHWASCVDELQFRRRRTSSTLDT